MTRLERLRHELVALAESLRGEMCQTCHGARDLPAASDQRRPICSGCWGACRLPHPLGQPLRGIAWSLLPREKRYKAPEHGGGPLIDLSCGHCNATGRRGETTCDRCGGRGGWSSEVGRAADELVRLARFALPQQTHDIAISRISYLAAELRSAVVQARPGETLDDVLRREGLEIAEETCATCEGDGLVVNVYGWTAGHFVRCPKCINGRVVAEDAIEVRVAGQVRYARRRET